MIPSRQDGVNLFQEIGYFLGFRKEKPRFDRFNWKEKFDYWAIFWGMPVMAGSGFILMYPVFVTQFLPGWAVPAALVAHSDEAMLALTWIFLVHVFFNHFAPGVFPINTSIFTVTAAIEVGRDFLADTPADIGRILVELIGQRMAAELDDVVANGDGTTQPEGIFTAAGLGTATADNENGNGYGRGGRKLERLRSRWSAVGTSVGEAFPADLASAFLTGPVTA